MSKRIKYFAKRLPKKMPDPQKCSDKELKSICQAYTDYLDSMCDEDGYVNTYERTAERVSPWFDELEKRGIK